MIRKKIKNINQNGSAHHLLLPLIAIVGVGLIGLKLLANSNAESVTAPGTFNVVSYNVRFDTPPSEIVSDINRLINVHNADVLTLQETNYDTLYMAIRDAYACDTCAFGIYAPRDTEGEKETMFLWRKARFELAGSGAIQATQEVNVSRGLMRALYVNYVRLKLVDQETRVVFMTNHLPAHVENDGKPDKRYKDLATRLALYDRNMAAIKQKISETENGVPVITTGDFNVDYHYDKRIKYGKFPFKQLGNLGTKSNWTYTGYAEAHPKAKTLRDDPKNRHRLIDYIFLSKKQTSANINTTDVITYSMHSDHYPIIANLTLSTPKLDTSFLNTLKKGDKSKAGDKILPLKRTVPTPSQPLKDLF